MPEDNEFTDVPNESPKPIGSGDQLYAQLSEAVPPRDVDEPKSSGGYSRTSGNDQPSFLGGGAKLTDVQAAFRQLVVSTPFDWLNMTQRSRIFPDVYMPMSRILAKGVVRESIKMYKRGEVKAPISLVTALAYTNTVMSIAIDGEGIFDILQLVGASQAQERAKEDKII